MLVEANALLLADMPGAASRSSAPIGSPTHSTRAIRRSARSRSTPTRSTFEVSAHYSLARCCRPRRLRRAQHAAVAAHACPTCAACSSATTTRSPSCPTRRCARAPPTRASATSRPTSRLHHRRRRASRCSTTSTAGASRRRTRPPRCPSPSSRSSSGSTATSRSSTATPIKDGILEWNKAFERIGFKDAIASRSQPDDADFDTPRHAPRLGPLADRARSRLRRDRPVASSTRAPARSSTPTSASTPTAVARRPQPASPSTCRAAGAGAVSPLRLRNDRLHVRDDDCTGEAASALSLLEARGELDADSPEVEAFVAAFLKDATMHEVGHTLGLRHNFRASTIYTPSNSTTTSSRASTASAGSVMEYNAAEHRAQGREAGRVPDVTLGPYDYWAIEYAYKRIRAASRKRAELAQIAARSHRAGARRMRPTKMSSFLALDPDPT